MRVLVTGGTGFIGRALLPTLLGQGYRVRCAMRRPAALPAGAEPVLVGDLAHVPDWRPALDGVAAIIHLAGLAHLPRGAARAEAFAAVNVGGTVALAEAAANAGIERLIFVSSIGVHGDRSSRPLREEDAPEPRGAYAQSKIEAEQRLVAIASKYGMSWCIVRPPLVYGADAPGNFQRLRELIARGWPLPLGSATAKRSFIALDNLVSVLAQTLVAPQARNGLFLASDGEDVSTAEFVGGLARHMGTRIRLISVPPSLVKAAAAMVGRADDASKLFDPLQIDCTRLRERLGWRPIVSVEEGLRRAVER